MPGRFQGGGQVQRLILMGQLNDPLAHPATCSVDADVGFHERASILHVVAGALTPASEPVSARYRTTPTFSSRNTSTPKAWVASVTRFADLAAAHVHAVGPLRILDLGRRGGSGLGAGGHGQGAVLGDVDQVAVVAVTVNLDAHRLGVLVEGVFVVLANLEVQAVQPLRILAVADDLRGWVFSDHGHGTRFTDVDEVVGAGVEVDFDAELLGIFPILLAPLADAEVDAVGQLGRVVAAELRAP